MVAADNILFNALKHHLGFIQEQLKHSLVPDLKILGNSQMDIYYGTLSLKELYNEVIVLIPANDEVSYLQWLNNSYKEITLSDTSRWVLLHGTAPGKFVHLHPARYSPHSLRVKASILKTAIAVMTTTDTIPDLHMLNYIRQSIHLSPVKSLELCEHLWEVLKLLRA